MGRCAVICALVTNANLLDGRERAPVLRTGTAGSRSRGRGRGWPRRCASRDLGGQRRKSVSGGRGSGESVTDGERAGQLKRLGPSSPSCVALAPT